MSPTLKRTLLPISFFGALIAFLMIGEQLNTVEATTITLDGTDLIIDQTPTSKQELPRCKEHTDCPLPTTYCSAQKRCTQLIDPVCDCSQPQVLRCREKSGRARFLFCPVACTSTEGKLHCA